MIQVFKIILIIFKNLLDKIERLTGHIDLQYFYIYKKIIF